MKFFATDCGTSLLSLPDEKSDEDDGDYVNDERASEDSQFPRRKRRQLSDNIPILASFPFARRITLQRVDGTGKNCDLLCQ